MHTRRAEWYIDLNYLPAPLVHFPRQGRPLFLEKTATPIHIAPTGRQAMTVSRAAHKGFPCSEHAFCFLGSSRR